MTEPTPSNDPTSAPETLSAKDLARIARSDRWERAWGPGGPFDGRMGRKWFAILATICFVAAIGFSLVPPVKLLGLPFGLVMIALFCRRLHDLGQSGWWQLPLMLLRLPIGMLNAAGADASGYAVFVLIADVVFIGALAVWPGMAEANDYGPPPGGRSAADMSEVFR